MNNSESHQTSVVHISGHSRSTRDHVRECLGITRFRLSQSWLRFTAKRFERLAGGKRSATTGSCRTQRQHPEMGARTANSVIPSGCVLTSFSHRWCACRRPPANLWHPFRMNRREFHLPRRSRIRVRVGPQRTTRSHSAFVRR